jgi:uncharacterized protein (DUF1800 family)
MTATACAGPAAAVRAATTDAAVGRATTASAPLEMTDSRRILHVLNRLGFGARPGDVERVRQMGLARYIAQQLAPEDIDDSIVDARLAGFTALDSPGTALFSAYETWQREAGRLSHERDILQHPAVKAAARSAPAATAAASAHAPAAAADETTPVMMNGASGGDGVSMGAMAAGGADPEASLGSRLAMDAEQADQGARTAEMVTLDAQANAARSTAGRLADTADTQLAAARVLRAVESRRQLLEVMVDFWTNHFNVDQRKDDVRLCVAAYDRDVIRPYVLGRFRDLLEATARSPAMLIYLDNFQSSAPPHAVRGKPTPRGGLNENYGREIMELHTLGVDGGYTQDDVIAVARCFTGWTIDRTTGAFHFDPRRHDNDEKTVLGHVIPAGGGQQDGETVLDILASQPATMRHISYELCQRLVSDTPPAALVARCVDTWKRTGGDIRAIVRTIVTSPEFFAADAYRDKTKSPFEYVVSAVRAAGGTIALPATVEPSPLAGAGIEMASMTAAAPAPTTASAAAATAMALDKPAPNPADAIRPLLAQISQLGEPLYQFQPPTGYPEDARKWVSAGALIGRINFAVNLASGHIKGVTLPDPTTWTVDAAAPASGDALVTDLADATLGGDLSAHTLQVIDAQIAAFAPPDTPIPARQEAPIARRTMALLLGSPEFGRR